MWSEATADDAEHDLIVRIQAGEERALEALHVKYWSRLVKAAARYVRDEELARDVVQDVFLDIWYRRDTWAPHGSIAAYLYGATRNRAISVARHEQRMESWSNLEGGEGNTRDSWRADTALSAEQQTASDPSQAERMEVAELDALLRARLHALPERCRETYLLYRGGDLTVAEVANVMGVSTETAKTQIKRAMTALREVVVAYRGR